MHQKTALILTDGKPGHESQSLAFCRLTGLKGILAPVSYPNRFYKLLSYAMDHLRLQPNMLPPAIARETAPAVVIGTGSTTWFPVKCIGRSLKIPTVAILMPRGYRLNFDLIIAPAMDRPPVRDNILELPINLCDARPEVLAPQLAEFAARHQQRRPAIGVIIGGDSAACRLPTDTVVKAVLQTIASYPEHEIWLTTSRRTAPELEKELRALPLAYGCFYSTDRFNPIPAFIDKCDRLLVTSDSASMLSECVSRGNAAVEVILAQHRRPNDKFIRQIRQLEHFGALSIFGQKTGSARKKVDLAALLQTVPARLGLSND